jgi:hypothetical protein
MKESTHIEYPSRMHFKKYQRVPAIASSVGKDTDKVEIKIAYGVLAIGMKKVRKQTLCSPRNVWNVFDRNLVRVGLARKYSPDEMLTSRYSWLHYCDQLSK